MIIQKNKVVTIEYTLTDEKNEILDSSKDLGPLNYLHGYKNIIPGLETALENKKSGDTFKIAVEPKDAYGLEQKDLIVDVPRTQFDSSMPIEVGMQFEAESDSGSQLVTVVAVTDETIKINANHPLVGKKLFFDVEVTNVRDATEEEIANGDLIQEHSCKCGGNCSDEEGCDSGDCNCDSGTCSCGGSCH